MGESLSDVTRIISELERQRNAIELAISALQGLEGRKSTPRTASQPATPTPKKRQLSPEGRKRIVEATKKRWAAQRAALKRESAVPQSKIANEHTASKSVVKRVVQAKKKRLTTRS